MSIQNIKKALFIGATLFSFNAHAQIEKGATTLGGSLQYNASKSTSSISNNSSTGFSISPSYGRFITDKIMVKGQLSTTLGKGNIVNSGTNAYDYKSNLKALSIDAEVRYYFNPKAKWKFFGSASASKSFQKYSFTSTQNNVSTTNKYNFDDLDYSIFGGVNKFINEDIALEAKLGYSTDINGLLFRGLGIQRKGHYIGFNLGLNNFTNFKTNDKNFDGLIDKDRSIINGNLSVNAYKDQDDNNSFFERKGVYATLDLEYGRFVAKGLLVGAKANFIIEKDFQNYSVSPYVQYFYPISKRLMLHGLAEIQGSINQNNTTNFTFRGAAGLTYFLSKNVALSANLLDFSKSFNKGSSSFEWQNRNIGSNLGLRFFLK